MLYYRQNMSTFFTSNIMFNTFVLYVVRKTLLLYYSVFFLVDRKINLTNLNSKPSRWVTAGDKIFILSAVFNSHLLKSYLTFF